MNRLLQILKTGEIQQLYNGKNCTIIMTVHFKYAILCANFSNENNIFNKIKLYSEVRNYTNGKYIPLISVAPECCFYINQNWYNSALYEHMQKSIKRLNVINIFVNK